MIVVNILQQTLKYQSTNPPRREDIVENQPRGVGGGGRTDKTVNFELKGGNLPFRDKNEPNVGSSVI